MQPNIWTTEGQTDRARVDYWRQAICEAIFELDFLAASPSLNASLRQTELGAIKLSEVSISTPHEVIRSRQAAAGRSDEPRLNLNYLVSGHWTVEHYGREHELKAGELMLLDSRQPYTVRARAGTEHVAVHLPLGWLRCWLPNPEEAVARAIGHDAAWHDVLVTALRSAPLVAGSGPGVDSLCAEQIAGGLALALGPASSRHTTHGRLLLLRIHRTIADFFHHQDLEAAGVARLLGISPRYLHKVLAREGTTYGRELIRVRLDRARAMLADPRFDDLSVAEIGWRCGFSDASHFSRRFKSLLALSPGAFREAARGVAAGDAKLH